MKTNCPQCQNPIGIAKEHYGVSIRCKKCGKVFRPAHDPLEGLSVAELRAEATERASSRRESGDLHPDPDRPVAIESLLIRVIEIQEKQLHWLRVIAITVAVAFALVFVFGMTFNVR